MKKILILLLFISTIFLTSCSGKSAYDLAVENGFVGTVEDYLESLEGNDALDITIDDLFNYLVEKGDYNSDEYSLFIKDYLNGYISEEINEEVIMNHNLRSVVNIKVSFKNVLGQNSYYAGSGVVYKIDEEYSYVITNHHVISSSGDNSIISSEILVSTYNSTKEVQGVYVGSMSSYDLAVIKVKLDNVVEVKVSSNRNYAGDNIFVIGNPLGYGLSITKGIISVESEYITVDTIESLRVLRIDASINGGNSGGALFNKYGELIGIIDAKVVSEEVEGIGYALPISYVDTIAKHIIKINSSVDKVELGIYTKIETSYMYFDEEDLKYYIKDKVVIESVVTNSAAYKAGLEANLELISVIINDKEYKIERNYTLSDLLFDVYKEDNIILKVYSKGVIKEIEITL
ncbi:MAG: S1C family serine protease [bacterium]